MAQNESSHPIKESNQVKNTQVKQIVQNSHFSSQIDDINFNQKFNDKINDEGFDRESVEQNEGLVKQEQEPEKQYEQFAKRPQQVSIPNQTQMMMSQSSDLEISYHNNEEEQQQQQEYYGSEDQQDQQNVKKFPVLNRQNNTQPNQIYKTNMNYGGSYEQEPDISQIQSDWDLGQDKDKEEKEDKEEKKEQKGKNNKNNDNIYPNSYHSYNHNFDNDMEVEDQSVLDDQISDMYDEGQEQGSRQQGQNYGSGIYNTSQMYSNTMQKNQSGFYPKPEYQEYPGGQRNTDGKHLDEQFRRKFAKMLLDKTRGQSKNTALDIVSRQSDKIKVYSNEVLIWMSIYKIVFQIQHEKSKKSMSQIEVVRQIESRCIDYLNQHPNEKKYKFIKICNRTFRALGIKKTTGDYWLREMFKRFHGKLYPNVNTRHYLQKLEKKINSEKIGRRYQKSDSEDDFLTDPRTMPKSNFNYIQLRFQNRYSNSFGQFPMDTKQRVIKKIDKAIQTSVNKIFFQKISEFCIDNNEMKKWYMKFGKYQIFNPSSSYQGQPDRNKAFLQKSNIPTRVMNFSNQDNIPGVKRLESELLNYIKMNANMEKSKVYTAAINIVKRMQIKQLQNQDGFSNWFNKFLANYCNVNNNYVSVKIRLFNPNFQIPINTSYSRPTNKEVLLYGNPSKRGLI